MAVAIDAKLHHDTMQYDRRDWD